MVNASSAGTWLMEEQKHKGVGHVFTFSPNAFFSLVRITIFNSSTSLFIKR